MPERAYIPAEQVRVDGRLTMIALHDEAMTVGEVMDWLMVRGFVVAVPCDCGECAGAVYRGWGRPYFAIPADKVTHGD